MNITKAVKNGAVFGASVAVGTPIGQYAVSVLSQTGYIATGVILVSDFVVYVFLSKWFGAKAEL